MASSSRRPAPGLEIVNVMALTPSMTGFILKAQVHDPVLKSVSFTVSPNKKVASGDGVLLAVFSDLFTNGL
jgi:hypothetical protein